MYKSTINVKNLEVLYNSSPIKKNLYILNYTFLYSGQKDILANDFNKGIEISLQKDGNILSHDVILNPYGINTFIDKSSREFNIKADLIKDEDFFTGEILIEYDGKIEDPTSLFNVNSRLINVDKPKLYNYRYVKAENELPIFDWVIILSGPPMLIIMLFSVYFVTGSTASKKKFSKDGSVFDSDSLTSVIISRFAVHDFIKEQGMKYPILDSFYNEDLKFIKAVKISEDINLLTMNDAKKIPTKNNFLGFSKSDTFILGDGYTLYYERESTFSVFFLIIFMITLFTFAFTISYKANRNRLLDIRLRRLYLKSKKVIAEAK